MKEVKFIVKIGYVDVKEFEFNNVEEAIHFAVTAKKTSVDESIRVRIEIEWTDEHEQEEE